jgi:hypothetical protein
MNALKFSPQFLCTIQHNCFLFPLTAMYLDFPSFALNSTASAAVSKAINNVFMSFSDLSILRLYHQQIQLALRALRSQRAINSTSRFCDVFNFRIIP